MVLGWNFFFRAIIARSIAVVFLAALIVAIGTHALQGAETPRQRAFHVSVINGDILGSAYMIDHGLAVTNAHVVAGRRVGQTIVFVMSSGKRVSARVAAISARMDLAILSVAHGLGPIARPAQRGIRRGTAVSAVGIVASSGNTTRRHIIRGTVATNTRTLLPFGRGFIVRMPQIAKGFSGGPVFNNDGQVVGMIAALRPAQSSPSGQREAFVLLDEYIRREISHLIGQ